MPLIGLTIFGVSNVAAGLAESSEMMLASRFLSGVWGGAAMIMPVTLAVITSTFPEAERSKGIGVWAAVAGGGGILGMYLSALHQLHRQINARDRRLQTRLHPGL